MSHSLHSANANQAEGSQENSENKNILMDLFSALSMDKDQHTDIDSASQNFQQAPKFDKVLDNVEDIEDILEYAQEILDIKNETTQR